MQQAETIVLLLGLVAALVVIAQKLTLPYPVVLVLAGLALSFVPRLPEVKLNPDIVFYFFLPPLIDPAASGSPPNSSGPRRRKSGQRCHRTGGASIRSGSADDRDIFVRPGNGAFRRRRARGHRSWSVNRFYRALDPSTPR